MSLASGRKLGDCDKIHFCRKYINSNTIRQYTWVLLKPCISYLRSNLHQREKYLNKRDLDLLSTKFCTVQLTINNFKAKY